MTISTMDFATAASEEVRGCHAADAAAARPSARFLGSCAALFVAGAAGTVAWCASMADMPGMAMPGGWTMSMMWMRMPDQTWAGAAASFLGMWTVMMVAMMTPSLVPVLWRCRQSLAREGGGAGRLGAGLGLVGAGYFLVWAAQGAIVYPLGVAAAGAAIRWPSLARAAPLGVAAVMLAAGALQTSRWKARRLACCRALPPARKQCARTWTSAWRHGVHLGLHCGACCAGLTAVVLVAGVMDLAVMAAVTVAVTAERLAFAGARVARAVGAVLVVVALFLIVRWAWPG